MRLSLLLTLLLSASISHAADLGGKVVNQATGEPLASAAVVLLDTPYSGRTGHDGAFALTGIPAGQYTLMIETVGFWVQKIPVELSDGDPKEFSISLTPQGARRSERVEVTADIFGGTEPAEVGQFNLTTSELKQTDTVFGGDLFRSVQTLPGVTGSSNNDFYAQFTVLGADFSKIGVYVDDVFVRQPFHGISSEQDGASIGVMNDETIDTLSLTPLAFSERYEEAIGGALSIRTREGSREKTSVSVGVGMAESHGTAEGSLPAKRGSWLLSGRRSYLGYLTRHAVGSTTVEPLFSDLTARLALDLAPRQTIDFLAIGGTAHVDNSFKSAVDPNNFFTGDSDVGLVRLGWRAGITPNVLVSSYLAFTSQAQRTKNQLREPLEKVSDAEWAGGATLNWDWRPKQTFEAGWTLRRLSGSTSSNYYWPDPQYPGSEYTQSGTGTRQGFYVQQSSAALHGRLEIMGGVRWDQMSAIAIHPVSPQISGSMRIASTTSLIWGIGRYRQFPEVETVSVVCGQIAPLFDTANHYLAGVEQKIGENTRIRLQGFDRRETTEYGVRGGLEAFGQTSCGGIVRYHSTLPRAHETTRGAEIIVQRRSSNRLSGWVSFTLLHQRDNTAFFFYDPSDPTTIHPILLTLDGTGDQRNSVNAFGMYRLRPTLNLSGKLLYGSGYPFGLVIGNEPMQVSMDGKLVDRLRTEPFLRADIRVDKALTFHRKRITFHGEILNLTNHHNMRFVGTQFKTVGGDWRYFLTEDRSLGFTPTVGVDIQF